MKVFLLSMAVIGIGFYAFCMFGGTPYNPKPMQGMEDGKFVNRVGSNGYLLGSVVVYGKYYLNK